MKTKIPVGILGATGAIGQRYVERLLNHPWFEIAFLAGSQEGAYEERVKWSLHTPVPKGLFVHSIDQIEIARKKCACVFSALPHEQASIYETRYASEGLVVISSASTHRMSPDVPLLIPEINLSHLDILPIQRKKRGWNQGCIVTKPNCAIQSFMLPLTSLHHQFGIRKLFITTLQSISGAGNSALSAASIHDNVIPYISGEEEKVESEPLKIWGQVINESIQPLSFEISAQCNRVPVLTGHLACVSVAFDKTPSEKEILKLWENTPSLELPSSPSHPIFYRSEPERPQHRFDADTGSGMSVTVGRLRRCPLLDYRFVGLSHNTLRGGAGGGVLIAESMHTRDYF